MQISIENGKLYFFSCNMMARRFYSCSTAVKQRLFKSLYLCFYDVALWNNFTKASPDKFRSTYIKYIKEFVGTINFSVTVMLAELNLQTFDALIDIRRSDFQRQITHSHGSASVF